MCMNQPIKFPPKAAIRAYQSPQAQPLVKGGQGRTDESVAWSGVVVFLCLSVLALATGAALAAIVAGVR